MDSSRWRKRARRSLDKVKINANSAQSGAEGDNDTRHNVPPCLHHLTLCIQFTSA